jgi:hypothetical protein
MKLSTWSKEPLVHFLALGAGLFLLFHLLGPENTEAPDTITVTPGKVESLYQNFKKRWLRPPTEKELQGLVAEYIREEVLFREATAMGLDRDDTVIRRRMRQKMQFLFEDVAAQAEPTEEELQAYLDENPDYFRTEPLFTFKHIYLNPDRHDDALQSDAERLLELLRQGSGNANIETLCDSIMLPHSFARESLSSVGKLFGEDFAQKLQELPVGQWQGPVESGYGVHLVLIQNRREGRIPALDEVRDTVLRELQNVRRNEVNEATYQRLLDRYTVIVEPIEGIGGKSPSAEIE